MKATEFVKKFGLDEAKEIVDGLPEKFKYKPLGMICWDNNSYKYSDRFKPRRSLVNMADLKRLVESHELTFLFGDDISYAKKYLKEMLFKFREDMEFYVEDDCRSYSLLELKQAIADVESCKEN